MTHRTERTSSKTLLAALPLLTAPLLVFGACAVEDGPEDGGNTGGAGVGGSSLGGKGGASGGVAGTTSGSAGTAVTAGSSGTTGVSGGAAGTTGGGSGGAAPTGGSAGSGGVGPGGGSGAGGVGGAVSTGGSSGVGGFGGNMAGAGGSMAGFGGSMAGASGAGGSVGGAGGQAAGGAAGSSAGTAGSGGGDVGRSAGCGKSRTLMNGRRTIQSGGNREFILRVPDNYDNETPYRLIFAYHWLNGNATQVAEGGNGGSTEDPYYGLWDLAQNSTIFVAPQGLNNGWANSGGADITFTDAMLEQIQNDLCIDTTRIFATGFSYGAGMSFALACARPDVFRGVALYAGAQLSGCTGGTSPVAYFHVHGVADSVLSLSQGKQLRDKFVTNNGCTPMNPPDAGRGSGMHTCTSYQGCDEGYPLRWCTHGGDHNPTEKDSGQNKSWVPGEAWDFISQF